MARQELAKPKKRSATAPRFSCAPEDMGRKITKWYQRHKRDWPWRQLWQEHGDPWHVWVSEIMLQQTVIKAVLPKYESFLKQYPTPSALAAAAEEDVRLAVRGLGYYRRFASLHKAAAIVAERGYPETFEGWKELPGIGDYTAAAISSICNNAPVAVVDGNVERVLCRLLDWRVAPNDPKLKPAFRERAQELLPPRVAPGDFNQGLMELGQTLCGSTPNCDSCPVSSGCQSLANSSQALAPAAKIKKAKVDIALRLSVHQLDSKVVLYRRPSTAKFLKETWGFVTEINHGCGFEKDGDGFRGKAAASVKIGAVKHNITNHRIVAEIHECQLASSPSKSGWEFRLIDPKKVEELLVSNMDRKAWELLQKSQ